jgi:hypothetical protein
VAQSEGNDLPHCSNAETASVNAALQRLHMHHSSGTSQESGLLLVCSRHLLRCSQRLAKNPQLQVEWVARTGWVLPLITLHAPSCTYSTMNMNSLY